MAYGVRKLCYRETSLQSISIGQPHKILLHGRLITNSKTNLKYGLTAHFNKAHFIITQTWHSENDISLHGIEYNVLVSGGSGGGGGGGGGGGISISTTTPSPPPPRSSSSNSSSSMAVVWIKIPKKRVNSPALENTSIKFLVS
jgi:hypothetical protein